MRVVLTTRFVWAMSMLILLACLGWAHLVQHAVPDICAYDRPPPHAQFIHCD